MFEQSVDTHCGCGGDTRFIGAEYGFGSDDAGGTVEIE